MLKQILLSAASLTLVTFGMGQAAQAASFTVIASGLDSPRGMTFGPDGALYVAEAGKGGNGACIPSPSSPTAQLCYGATGAVTRIQNGQIQRVVTGLPSLAVPDGTDATGIHDLAFDASGKAYGIIGLAGSPSDRNTQIGIPDFGNLIAFNNLNGGSDWTRLTDFADYELRNNPDGTDVISNIYNLVIRGDRAYVLDAGANALLGVNLNGGEPSLLAVFPTRFVTNPLSGQQIPMQSVPTALAQGPDGIYYVGEYTGFPFPKGGARIYRETSAQPAVHAEGFTNIIDMAFDKGGNLYVLEFTTNSVLSGDPTGALIRLAPNGTRTTILSQGLFTPTGLAVGEDGAIYIANKGFQAGIGEILKIDAATVPEPAAGLGVVAVAVVGAAMRRRRQEA